MSGDVGSEKSFEWKKTSLRTPILFVPHSPHLPASYHIPGYTERLQCWTDSLWETVSLGLRIGHPWAGSEPGLPIFRPFVLALVRSLMGP